MRSRQPLAPIAIALFALACTPEARVAGVTAGVDIALCVAQNQELDDPLVIAKCIREGITPDVISSVLAQQRLATRRAALRATCANVPAPTCSCAPLPAASSAPSASSSAPPASSK